MAAPGLHRLHLSPHPLLTEPPAGLNSGSRHIALSSGRETGAASLRGAARPRGGSKRERGWGGRERQPGREGMVMAPWQTPDRDQLTAKYLIRPFALTQLAPLPRSNEVSCTCAGAGGCLLLPGGTGVSACPHTHPRSTLTAPVHPQTLPPCTRVCCTRCCTDPPAAQRPPHRSARQQPPPAAPQPLRCFTTRRGSLSPMKYICGSARGDKLLNCVCSRFMVWGAGSGEVGGRAASQRPQPARPSHLRGRQQSPRRGHSRDHMQTQRE